MRRWTGRAGWSVADQALFVLPNFALNLLLARWLTPAEYGAFAVAYQVFLVIGTLHDAFLLEPMQVFSHSRHRDRLGDYTNIVVHGQWAFSAFLTISLLLTACAVSKFGDAALARAFLGLALAGPFILWLWLMRRACYARLRPRLAASTAGLYVLLMSVGIGVLCAAGALTLTTALLALGLSSAAAALSLTLRLGVRPFPPRPAGQLARMARIEHWRYGRWASANGLLAAAPAMLYYTILPLWGGLEAAATLRALLNLMLPLIHLTYALNALLLPTLVRQRDSGLLPRTAQRVAMLFGSVALAYVIVVAAAGGPVIAFLYDGRYTDAAPLLWVLGLWHVLMLVGRVVSVAVRALERPDQAFWAQLGACLCWCTAGVWAVAAQGIAGVGIAGIVGALVMLFVLAAQQRAFPPDRLSLNRLGSSRLASLPSAERSRADG